MPLPSVTLPIEALRTASRDAQIVRAVSDLMADVEAEGLGQPGRCRQCGDCCRFSRDDHRLFVTTLELAYLLAHLGDIQVVPTASPVDCVFLADGRCSIYAHRMLACRTFRCEVSVEDQQPSDGASWHDRMVNLHRILCVPYCYVEWADALRQLASV